MNRPRRMRSAKRFESAIARGGGKGRVAAPARFCPGMVLEGALYRRLRGYLELMRADASGRLPVLVEERFGGRGSGACTDYCWSRESFLSAGGWTCSSEDEAGEYRVVDFKTVGGRDRGSTPDQTKKRGQRGSSSRWRARASSCISTRGGLRARPDALPEDARVSGAYVLRDRRRRASSSTRAHLRGGRGAHGGRGCAFGLFPRLGRGGTVFPDALGCPGAGIATTSSLCGPDRAERAARKEGRCADE